MEENMTSSKEYGICRPLALALAILFILLLIPSGVMQVSATETDTTDLPVVRIENKTVHRGQTFELQIYLDQNPGLVSLMLELEYDKTAMELVGISHKMRCNPTPSPPPTRIPRKDF